MDKAILIMDMPNSCRRCMCYVLGESNNFCSVTKFAIFDGSTKPHHCPLKSVPSSLMRFSIGDEYAAGYNDCLDEILGQ